MVDQRIIQTEIWRLGYWALSRTGFATQVDLGRVTDFDTERPAVTDDNGVRWLLDGSGECA